MRTSRRKMMQQYIQSKEMVTMDELCNHFKISINTARTDVAYLVSLGVARKTYGGVCSDQTFGLTTFEKRRLNMLESKREIGRYAASLINDGEVIFIDSGTTTMQMLDFMGELEDVTIVTPSLSVINKAISMPKLTVISLPGTLDRRTNSFMQADTSHAISNYNIDRAFMAATSISSDGSANNMSMLEYEIKKAAIRRSEKTYLLSDSSKFGKSTLMTFGNFSEMEMVITDNRVDEHYIALCESLHTKIHLVEIPEPEE